MSIKSFRDLEVWNKAVMLTVAIHKACDIFPKPQAYSLIDQLQRATISISSNIAEGFARQHRGDKLRFYYFSRGSLQEARNQLILAHKLNYIASPDFQELFAQSTSVEMMLNRFIASARKFK